MVTDVTNRCIYSLNRTYLAPACLTPPVPISSRIAHSHALAPPHHNRARTQVQSSPPSAVALAQPARRALPRASPRAHLHSTSYSAPASRRQQRILSSIRERCAAFVLTARSLSLHTNESSSVGSADVIPPEIVNDILRCYTFTGSSSTITVRTKSKSHSPDQPTSPPHLSLSLDSIEGPLSHLRPIDGRHDVLPATSGYSSSSTAVVPLIAHRVSLPDKLNIIPLERVLPPAVAANYCNAQHGASLLRPASEVFALDLLSPLKPARVAGSREQYVALIARMLRVGMVRLISKPKAVNGVFAVGKDELQDRLIIDAQPANRLFIDSPPVRLPNPSHLVQLRVPADTEQHCELWMAKSDLSNFYHHLGLPEWMVSYFALPPLTPGELRSLGFEDETSELWPACLTLPMGFSHAVLLAQLGHEHVVYSSGALLPRDSILSMRSPEVTGDSAKHGIVVDDLFLFSLSEAAAQSAFDAVLRAYAAVGFVVKPSKVVRPTTQPVKVIGFVVSRTSEGHVRIALDPAAAYSLAESTTYLLRRGVATGTQLARLLGRWTWCMLLCRPTLSVVQHCYRYIEVANRRRFVLWPSVRRELWMLLGLLPLMHARLDVPLLRNIIATDASEIAAGVVCTKMTPALDQCIWQMCSSKNHAYIQTMLRSAADSSDAPLPPELLPHADGYDSFYAAVTGSHWSTIISSAWRKAEHINSLELRAVLLALHWLTSYPSSHSSRVYLLVDSTVALYALWKGRTSSAPLLVILRKISALLLASHISLLTGWLPSAVNPADEPSRRSSGSLFKSR